MPSKQLVQLSSRAPGATLTRRDPSQEKILLAMLPFWAPLSPPLGLAVLKSHLSQHNYSVEIRDFNVDPELWGATDRYFRILKTILPKHRVGNFYMMGHDLLTAHLMAHMRQSDVREYRDFVRILFRRIFLFDVAESQIDGLNVILDDFFSLLAQGIDAVVGRIRPSIFGLTVYSTSLAPSLFAFKHIREKYPDITTLMGGGVFADFMHPASPNFVALLKETEAYIDHIFVGEGEILLQRFLEGTLPKERVYTIKAAEQLDMSTVAPPDFGGLDRSAYVQMAAYATRSCPFQCSFCSETVQWGKFRAKAPGQIRDELQYLQRTSGARLFQFGDSLLNQVIDGLAQELLDNKCDIHYDAYLRADPEVCLQERVDLWARSGYYRARLGIESGSPNVLELMQKQIRPQQAQQALHCLATAGIKTSTFWVVGHPGESESDFEETLRFVRETASDIYEADWHPFYYFPQGQVFSKKWNREHGIEPLYPEEYQHLFIGQMWSLRTRPSPDEVFVRMNKFREVCDEVGIPNPYSLYDIHRADLRWQKLHDRAVPPVVSFMSNG